MIRRTIPILAGLGLAFLLSAGLAAGQEYYVATDGADANPGTLEKPFKDPVKAAAKLQPGDTLLFRAGEYKCRTNGVVGIGPSRSGAEGKPITFKNHQDEHVKIDCSGSDWGFTPNGWSWIVIDGFEIVNDGGYGMKISANHGNGKQTGEHVTVRNCEIHHTGNEGLFSFGTPHLTIENCHSHDAKRSHGFYLQVGCHNAVLRNLTSENNRGNSGIQLNASFGGIKDVLVERCLLRGNAQGFSTMGNSGCTFRHNVIVNNGYEGPRGSGYRELIMWTETGKDGKPGNVCEGGLFENNTFVNLVPEGHKMSHIVHSKSGTRGYTFRNNLFVMKGKPILTLENFEGFSFESNCLWRIGGGEEVSKGGSLAEFCKAKGLKESGNISKDPMFADLEKGDLHLKDGSPCLGAGAKDKDGKARDIGAYQRGEEMRIGCKLPWKKDEAK